jgi:hypothetical protein
MSLSRLTRRLWRTTYRYTMLSSRDVIEVNDTAPYVEDASDHQDTFHHGNRWSRDRWVGRPISTLALQAYQSAQVLRRSRVQLRRLRLASALRHTLKVVGRQH